MTSITFTITGLDKLSGHIKKLQNFVYSQKFLAILETAKNQLVSEAMKKAPRKTGLLISRIYGRIENQGTSSPRIKIGVNNLKYARAMEMGSQPHWISARNKAWLRWVQMGRKRIDIPFGGQIPEGATEVFKRSVWHPGNPKPKHFLKGGLEYIKPRLVEAIRKAIQQELSM